MDSKKVSHISREMRIINIFLDELDSYFKVEWDPYVGARIRWLRIHSNNINEILSNHEIGITQDSNEQFIVGTEATRQRSS